MNYLSVNRKTYDALAPEYQARRLKYVEHQKNVLQPFIERLHAHGHSPRVLEAGCGVGLDAGILMQNGMAVEAIELSERMAAFARRNVPGLQVTVGDFLNEPVTTAYDGILMSAFLQLFPADDAKCVLDKAHAHLSSGGSCFVSVADSPESKEGFRTKLGYTQSLQRFRKDWTQEELDAAMRAAGFRELVWFYDKDPLLHRAWMSVLATKVG